MASEAYAEKSSSFIAGFVLRRAKVDRGPGKTGKSGGGRGCKKPEKKKSRTSNPTSKANCPDSRVFVGNKKKRRDHLGKRVAATGNARTRRSPDSDRLDSVLCERSLEGRFLQKKRILQGSRGHGFAGEGTSLPILWGVLRRYLKKKKFERDPLTQRRG